ncbi:hypothetical protein QR680_011762 [Steinernema hermaphroditum]|uniref:Uncharacterized protein n=1 Tax=Steinernema hermaphroditum TaxID=289476 RepID=A0AA39LYM3_9BILA|nr:hypothetical protein QR680_011762 [Steinernema hermaphroditum]
MEKTRQSDKEAERRRKELLEEKGALERNTRELKELANEMQRQEEQRHKERQLEAERKQREADMERQLEAERKKREADMERQLETERKQKEADKERDLEDQAKDNRHEEERRRNEEQRLKDEESRAMMRKQKRESVAKAISHEQEKPRNAEPPEEKASSSAESDWLVRSENMEQQKKTTMALLYKEFMKAEIHTADDAIDFARKNLADLTPELLDRITYAFKEEFDFVLKRLREEKYKTKSVYDLRSFVPRFQKTSLGYAVTRAILQTEKSHCHHADHVVELRCENNRLRKLLNENGISYDQVIQPLSRRRRSSNESSLGSTASTSNSNDDKPE